MLRTNLYIIFPPTQQELKALVVAALGSGWVRLHPECLDIPANTASLLQSKPGLTPDTTKKQANLGICLEEYQLEWCL